MRIIEYTSWQGMWKYVIRYLGIWCVMWLALLALASLALAEINVLFTIDKKPVPQAVREKLQEHGCEWVVVNVTSTRILIDAIFPNKQLALKLKDYLVSNNYNPKLIRATKRDGIDEGMLKNEVSGEITGEAEIPFDIAGYLTAMPDEVTYKTDGTVLKKTRPVVPYETHNFMGWGKRKF